MISAEIYTLVTVVISLTNALYFKSDESTKMFSLIINCIYFGAKFAIIITKVEADGTIYNKVYAFIISIPIMLGLLFAVVLGVYIQLAVIMVNYVNVGLEVSKVITKFIAR